MDKTKNIFSFILVIALVIAIPISIYILKNGNLDFRINAFKSDEPKHVTIGNVTNDSFTVTWITEKPVYGGIKLTKNLEPITELETTSFHSVEVKGLYPTNDYTFKIISDGIVYEKEYTVKTAEISLNNPNRWVFGQVFDTTGIQSQRGGSISLTLDNHGNRSQVLTSTINENGGYKFNVSNVLDSALRTHFQIDGLIDLEFKIFTDIDTAPITKRFTYNIERNIQIPNIYLGDVVIDTIPGAID